MAMTKRDYEFLAEMIKDTVPALAMRAYWAGALAGHCTQHGYNFDPEQFNKAAGVELSDSK